MFFFFLEGKKKRDLLVGGHHFQIKSKEKKFTNRLKDILKGSTLSFVTHDSSTCVLTSDKRHLSRISGMGPIIEFHLRAGEEKRIIYQDLKMLLQWAE